MSTNRSDDHEHRQGNQAVNGGAHKASDTGNEGASVPASQTQATGGQDGPSEGEGQSPEIVVGEIVAWRWWMARKALLPTSRLCSLCRSNVWEPGCIVEGNPAYNHRLTPFH